MPLIYFSINAIDDGYDYVELSIDFQGEYLENYFYEGYPSSYREVIIYGAICGSKIIVDNRAKSELQLFSEYLIPYIEIFNRLHRRGLPTGVIIKIFSGIIFKVIDVDEYYD